MKVGDLVRYWRIIDDEGCVHGVITSDSFIDEELGPEQRVTVHWFDDADPTSEEVNVLLDPEMDYMEIISESR